jgi:hypothetical protein
MELTGSYKNAGSSTIGFIKFGSVKLNVKWGMTLN